jgi:hypothetical protein
LFNIDGSLLPELTASSSRNSCAIRVTYFLNMYEIAEPMREPRHRRADIGVDELPVADREVRHGHARDGVVDIHRLVLRLRDLAEVEPCRDPALCFRDRKNAAEIWLLQGALKRRV